MSDIAAKSKASSFRVSQIAMIGVVTAVTCVLGPLAVPIGPVPISLTNLVIYFSLYVLVMKMRRSAIWFIFCSDCSFRYFPVGQEDLASCSDRQEAISLGLSLWRFWEVL